MNESVPEEVLKATTKCPRNHSCLTTEPDGAVRGCRCNAKSVLGKNILFVKPEDNIYYPNYYPCPYQMHYGSEHICRCPTHYHRAGLRK